MSDFFPFPPFHSLLNLIILPPGRRTEWPFPPSAGGCSVDCPPNSSMSYSFWTSSVYIPAYISPQQPGVQPQLSRLIELFMRAVSSGMAWPTHGNNMRRTAQGRLPGRLKKVCFRKASTQLFPDCEFGDPCEPEVACSTGSGEWRQAGCCS